MDEQSPWKTWQGEEIPIVYGIALLQADGKELEAIQRVLGELWEKS